MTTVLTKTPPKSSLFWLVLINLGIVLDLLNYHAVDIIFTLAFIVGIAEAIKQRNPTWNRKFFLTWNTFNIFVIVFILASALGYFFGTPATDNLLKNVLALRWVFSFYACVYIGFKLHETKIDFKFSYIVILICMIYLFTKHYLDTNTFINFDKRLQGHFDNTNHLALALILIWSYILANLLYEKVRTNQILASVSLLSVTIALMATYSRTSWIGAIAATFISLVLTKHKAMLKASLGMAIMAVVAFFTNTLGIQDRILYSFDTSTNGAQVSRLIAWKVNWHIFLDHPIFGVGLERAAKFYPEYYKAIGYGDAMVVGNAHNQYFQILSGAGIIGFVSYLATLVMGLIYFYKTFKRSSGPEQKVALGGLLVLCAFMISSLTDTPFRLQECRNYLFLILGTAFGYLNYTKVTDETISKA
ncbi:O-antigen ligase [Bdellovibrio sp. KM01]|uniref:O-antigen ligase family protein n=1 Tax=Bdellovibrio sp. KM01 TaxID=2748865 RepID=UPI0015EA2600|nr:O-antigen ligase family protein [Bdellovibrio sp. KM01]QLY27032.1 O-antigen ligase family protein [Bdellovibrio sp. KM01]